MTLTTEISPNQRFDRAIATACRTHADYSLLPDDIFVYVFQFLKPSELARVALVCKKWSRLSSHNVVWQALFTTLFGKQDCQSKIITYKSEYKNRYFEEPQILILKGHQEKVEKISFHANLIITYPKMGPKFLWSLDSGKYQKSLSHDNAHHIAIDGNTTVSVRNTTVYVSRLENELFDYVQNPDDYAVTYVIAIKDGIVATAAGSHIQVWSCKMRKCLYKLNVNAVVKEMGIHNDSLACVYATHYGEVVEIFSLNTGKSLRQMTAENHAKIYQDRILCVNKNRTAVYTFELDGCLSTFPQAVTYFSHISLHKGVLISVSFPIWNREKKVNQTHITMRSAANGDYLQQFAIEDDWLVKDMCIQDDVLIVGGVYGSSIFNKNASKIAKIWKFKTKN